jgi:hypothetical protein
LIQLLTCLLLQHPPAGAKLTMHFTGQLDSALIGRHLRVTLRRRLLGVSLAADVKRATCRVDAAGSSLA